MKRARLINFVMAVGLVMVYFFIEELSVNFTQVFKKIPVDPGFMLADSREAPELDNVDSVLETDLEAEYPSKISEIELVTKKDASYSQFESLAFHSPAQLEGPGLNSPLENKESLSAVPLRLVIPKINLDAPILPAAPELVNLNGVNFQQWLSPDEYAVGWHESSARLGEAGNTVLNGHHNIHGEVFRYLIDLDQTDLIVVYSDQYLFTYQVRNKMIFPEKYETLEVRVNNAQWILPSEDERLTLITCWPYESNTHRLIIVARLLSIEELSDSAQGHVPNDLYEGQTD